MAKEGKKTKKTESGKPAKAVKKTATSTKSKTTPKKSAAKEPGKNISSKKAASKTAPKKKAEPKKATKKPASTNKTKKPAAKTTVTKATTAKALAVKKTVAKKATPKKAISKKTAVSKKAAATQAVGKSVSAKKTLSKKAAPKKATTKKATSMTPEKKTTKIEPKAKEEKSATQKPTKKKAGASPAKPKGKKAAAKNVEPGRTLTLAEGRVAPDFRLPASTGVAIRLKDFQQDKVVVLYFYPKDDTPGCTKEAKDFQNMKMRFMRNGAVVLGISPNDTKSHQKFSKKYSLSIPLLADEGAKISTKYGIWKERSLYGQIFMGIERTTIVIGTDGKIKRIYPKVKVDGHAAAVLEFVKSLKKPKK